MRDHGQHSHRDGGEQRHNNQRCGQRGATLTMAAVDCGVVINPDGAKSQVEGAIGFGLAAALYGAITIANGAVEQKNFDGFRVLRMNEMPTVEVHLVDSDEAPSGLGEPGVPPIAPAVANALFVLNGKRIRKLPMVA